MQHIAKEGRCFVISVNSVCKVSDFPPDYPPFTPEHSDRKPDGSRWEADDIVNRGGSCIVGPLGTFLAEPVWDKEDIVYASLDASSISESRVSSGHDAVRRTAQLRLCSSLISTPSEAIPDLMSCELPQCQVETVKIAKTDQDGKYSDCQHQAGDEREV